MQIDISAVSYSDALIYVNDYLSENPIFGITDEQYYALKCNFDLQTTDFAPVRPRLIW